MSEQVQAVLDGMVPALLDLQERDIFSDTEIQAIVARRRESEYLLRRRAPRKADFLDYLQQEINLEKLRKLRVQIGRGKDKNTTKATTRKKQQQHHHIGDRHIVQHIHLLWVRTLRKYRADKQLYQQYAAFCRDTKSYKRLAACYQQALRYHPTHIPFWKDAAWHEFWENGSAQNARVILQRALRSFPASQDLWLQSFVLEIQFVQKLQGRKAILLGRDVNVEEKEGQHKIAILVYDNAIQSNADSTELRIKFLDQCRLFPNTGDIQDYIVDSIERDFADSESAWIARAMYSAIRRTNTLKRTQKLQEIKVDEPQTKRQKSMLEAEEDTDDPVLQVIRKACHILKTEEMVLKAIRFLQNYSEYVLSSGPEEESIDEEQNDAEGRNMECEATKSNHQEAVYSLISEILRDAVSSDFYTPTVALLHSDFLVNMKGNAESAINVLQSFVDKKSSTGDKVPASVWTTLAKLYNRRNNETSIHVIEQGLKTIPMSHPDHLVLLLQLFGARLYGKSVSDLNILSEYFQQIMLLAPGFTNIDWDVEVSVYGKVTNVPTACLEYLRYCVEVLESNDIARKVCDAVLFNTTNLQQLVASDPEAMKLFVEESIVVEESESTMDVVKRLDRLLNAAIQMFQGTPFVTEYRQQRDELRFGSLTTRHGARQFKVPTFDLQSKSCEKAKIEMSYKTFHLMHLSKVTRMSKENFSWGDFERLFQQLDVKDKETWCIESERGADNLLSPKAFLAPTSMNHRAYCSFLIQNSTSTVEEFLRRIPVKEVPSTYWDYESAFWIFFGRNQLGNVALDGRPEHTDSITHDGTFHFQLSGEKYWWLRPTPELVALLRHQIPGFSAKTRLKLICKEGDVIVINTRLWFHRTVIPPHPHPSISYARDFHFNRDTDQYIESGMKNLDGLFALDNIGEGTVIFRESNMPNCELHRSTKDPNCEVVELDDGEMAIVSIRDIAAGEFFCTVESSSDDEDEIDTDFPSDDNV